ncbi:alpha/beta fold hydrolase [Paracoccus siganidrum]|uniref:Alpha/beta hydrolase n=1 Tax=Paracoccus siganidrum TaxID=1276757 RepID=A0A419A3Z3_9RHOB|nr:alpha/beta hydrolase [Paracoccus siganidrum]RJL08601.1 alpha/beta hydrolase [Paracoccus siganidrum]RMC27344.1 hypothetical protein C9E82_21980 [Paracoccus siganidrum]
MSGRWWLLPGTLCTAEVFEPLLGALAVSPQQCRSVRLDRPAVEDYAAELASVEDEDIVLGFSLGAILAAHHLDRMRALAAVLIAANPFADTPEKSAARLEQLARISVEGPGAVMAAAWPALVGPDARENPAVGNRIVAMAEQTVQDLPAQTELALRRPGAEPMLASARSRALFITGREDPAAPPDRAMRAAAIGRHELVLVDGAGHFLPLEAPRACAEAIRAFLLGRGQDRS